MSDAHRTWTPATLGPAFPTPTGAYSPVARAGDLLFVSGQLPRDPRTGALQGSDVGAQTDAALDNLRRLLEAAGSSLHDVVSVTVYLADVGDWDAFDAAYRRAFRPPYPARTTLGVALHGAGLLVEISAVARVRA